MNSAGAMAPELSGVYQEAGLVFQRALQPLRTQVPLTGAEWADRYFYLAPESSGTEGRWKSYPYQVALLNWMTSDDIEELNWQKSRRVGYTKCLLAAAGCLIEQKNRNIAIWQPTDGDAKDFVTDEVEPLLRDVEVLGRKLKCKVGAKSKWNTVEKKVFTGATLDIKGGKSARNFRRMTKDVAIYDETDAFDVDIDGEGCCFDLGDGRLDQAPFPKSIRGSTPKTKGMSLIEAAVESSDGIFHRYVACIHCGHLQRLEFSRLVWEHDDPETVVYACLNGCVLHYRDYPAMDANGRWQTAAGTYYEETTDRFFDADDAPIPKPRRIGVRIWAGYSYLRPWSYIVDRWLAASKSAKAGNINSLKAVINTLLGETFEEKGESVNVSALTGRGEDYLHGGVIPEQVLLICVGADVQGGANPRIELEFVGFGLEDETWSLDYVVIPGDPEQKQVWDHLDEQLLRRFYRTDGAELGVAAAFIDSGYLATEVYRFTALRRKRNIYSTKGVTTGTICNAGTWQGEKKNRSRAILRTCNVNDAKTIIYHRLRIEEPGPGYCHFPDHYEDDHFVRLTNEEKVERRRKGVLIGFDWVKKGPNEPLDCRCYASAAKESLNVHMGKMKLRLERMAARRRARQGEQKEPLVIPEHVDAAAEDEQIARRKPRRRRPRGQSWAKGWQ